MKPKVLLDSNIIIYSVSPEYTHIRKALLDFDICISKISIVETLGYHKLQEPEKSQIEQLILLFGHYDITDTIIQKATKLRQTKKMSVGDAIISATALIYQLPLMTRNIGDFEWIDDLTIINPFKQS